MADRLLQLSTNPTARRVVKTLGLPVPLPQKLRRARGPWEERPLADRSVVVHAHGELSDVLARALGAAGANAWVDGAIAPFQAHGEAWGRPPHAAGDAEPKGPAALVFDATGIDHPNGLRALYDFFQPRIAGIGTCGRLVVIGRPADKAGSVMASAAQRALLGFVKSAGREIGRNGSTANLVVLHNGAEDRLEGVLRFLLSDRSAYVTGQPLEVSKSVKLDVASLPAVRPLGGKVAVVTGAARGIGRSIAESLAREGAHVVCIDIPSADTELAQVADAVGGTPLLLDVTSAGAADAIVAAAAPHGGIDAVVHNAGVTKDKMLRNMKPEAWDMAIGINLAAVADLCEKIPLRPNGRLVLLSSIAGISGNMGQTNYSASKAGIIGLTEALGAKLAKKGVAVNAIAPGFIETRLTAAIPVATREVARRLNNLSQGGQPEDIAEVATFLCSPQAGALSGTVVRVCGGALVGA